jgi:hypothetical protein
MAAMLEEMLNDFAQHIFIAVWQLKMFKMISTHIPPKL